MPLTERQKDFIERMKDELGIDRRVGRSLSDLSTEKGRQAGISQITPDVGEAISKEILNITIMRIAERIR